VPGLGNAVGDVAGLTMLQRIIPNRVLGRVFGALEAQVFATVGVGSLLASGLIAWLGIRGAMIATGALLPGLVLLSWRRLHAIDETTVVPEEELALLRGVPMFAALPAVALEHLAAGMRPVSVEARARIFKKGEPGDRLYVIAAGEARVYHGRTTTLLGPGDYFGEIALMRGVPRTATVTARGALELFAVESEPFLAAVSGNRLCADVADKIVEDRCEVIAAERVPKRRVAAPRRASPKSRKKQPAHR
jgi:hypothetical protein